MFWNPKIHCTVCIIGTNHILYAKIYLLHLFLSIQHSEVIVHTHICSDSTVTSFLTCIILIFIRISERIPNIQSNERYLCIYMYIALRKYRILWKFISLHLFFLQHTAGFTAPINEYPEYSFYSEKLPHHGMEYPDYLGKFPKRSSEMAVCHISTGKFRIFRIRL